MIDLVTPAGPPLPEPPSRPSRGDARPCRRRTTADLRQESDTVVAALTDRLGVVRSVYGLRRTHLVDTARTARRLWRADALPSSAEFWRRTAWPRADLLVDASLQAVHLAGHRLRDAAADCDGPAHEIEPLLDGARSAMAEPLSARRTVDDMGRWWERRLRRAALTRSFPDLLVAPVERIPEQVEAVELALSSQPPWRHEDQLLVAFEIANREIERQGRLLLDQILRPATDPG